jgi:phospholysine phosphohistidine inorganic pyrophosphate phosphatase
VDESLDAAQDARALLIDLDGVVYRGDRVIEGAAAAIRWLTDEQIPHLFVTNTTSRPRTALVEKLSGFGIETSVDRIHAPPQAAAQWLKERGCRRLMLLVPEATQAAFADFTVVADARGLEGEGTPVDAVVVGDLGSDWSFERLNQAFRSLLAKPAPFLVALGMTRYWRAPDGLRLDTAPFVMALSHASGVEPTVLGKPAAAFFESALARLDVPASRAAMIGDDIRTDVAAAQSCGLRGVLVKTGKFSPSDLDLGIEPDLVIESIAELPRAAAATAST